MEVARLGKSPLCSVQSKTQFNLSFSLMLTRNRNLNYEELARLNPFFDKIMDLWNKSAMITNTMVSSNLSSSTSSSRSMHSGNDSSIGHRQSSISPLLNEYQYRLNEPVAEQSRVELHHSECLESDWMDSSSIGAPLRPTKTSHKKLFGENGWLGCTADMKDLPSDTQKFKGLRGFGRKVKKQVEELVSLSRFNKIAHTNI